MPTLEVAALDYRGFYRLHKTKVAMGLGAGLLAMVSLSAAANDTSTACELDSPVRFVAINSESSHVLLELERFIVEQGYGCQTEAKEVVADKGIEALVQQQADVYTEVWLNSVSTQWHEAEESDQVVRLGELYLGGGAAFMPKELVDISSQPSEHKQSVGECVEGAICSEDPLAYPDYAVFTGIQQQFSEQAPQLSAFLANIRIRPELMDGLLTAMHEQGANAADTARRFLHDYEDVWTQWVPRQVALRVKEAL